MKIAPFLLLLFSLQIVSLSQQSPFEKPPDVEILKFRWAEATLDKASNTRSPDSVLDASQRTPQRPDTYPSPNGPRGPIKRVPTPDGTRPKSEIVKYTFFLSIKNAGVKTVARVQWACILLPKDSTEEPFREVFESKATIEPGNKKRLQETSLLVRNLTAKKNAAKAKLPTRSSFTGEDTILHIDYADGSSWDKPVNIPTFPTRKQRVTP